jgi:hypothetical protein
VRGIGGEFVLPTGTLFEPVKSPVDGNHERKNLSRYVVGWESHVDSRHGRDRESDFTLTAGTEFGFDGGGFLSDPRV